MAIGSRSQSAPTCAWRRCNTFLQKRLAGSRVSAESSYSWAYGPSYAHIHNQLKEVA